MLIIIILRQGYVEIRKLHELYFNDTKTMKTDSYYLNVNPSILFFC